MSRLRGETEWCQAFWQPLDHVIPMVATADIGRTAAALLQRGLERRSGSLSSKDRVVTRPPISDVPLPPLSAAEVRMEPVPRETWEQLFRSRRA